jgi:hypothetical protein
MALSRERRAMAVSPALATLAHLPWRTRFWLIEGRKS